MQEEEEEEEGVHDDGSDVDWENFEDSAESSDSDDENNTVPKNLVR